MNTKSSADQAVIENVEWWVTACDATGMAEVFATVNGHDVSVMDNLTTSEADVMAEDHNAALMNFRAWFSADTPSGESK